jgi:two-component system phosphate regulon sensor histidine kinase PhoR
VPIAELQKQVFSLLVPRARERNLVLSVDPQSPPCQVLAERRALEQVLYNLLDNAIKYCSAGVEICLGWQPRDGHVRVTLRDGGPGIAEQHLPRLFERFYRVDAGRSRDLGGTGLGLAIVKHLVEAMGGEVGVSSARGQGTTFWFTLRIAHETDRKQDAA